jgi:hypothetical protein
MPKMSISSGATPRHTPSATITATITSAAFPRIEPSRSRFSWSGVRPAATVCTSRLMRPNSVDIPVATTTA